MDEKHVPGGGGGGGGALDPDGPAAGGTRKLSGGQEHGSVCSLRLRRALPSSPLASLSDELSSNLRGLW